MEVMLFTREWYERTRTWYVLASIVCVLLLVFSLFGSSLGGGESWMPNAQSRGSAGLLIIFGRAYRHYVGGKMPEKIQATITEAGLMLGNQCLSWSSLTGFAVEAQVLTGELHNLIICTNDTHQILTFVDTQERILLFLEALREYVKQVETVQQSVIEIWTRRLKI